MNADRQPQNQLLLSEKSIQVQKMFDKISNKILTILQIFKILTQKKEQYPLRFEKKRYYI